MSSVSFRRLAPYLLLLAVAVALVACADQFPSSMPTHWDSSGKPSRFTPRSGFGMASPILLWTFPLVLLDRLLTYRGRRPLFSPQLARALESMRWLFPVIAMAYAFAPVWGGTPIRVGYGAYVDPTDRRLLVPKASGEGWRLTFARPTARVLAIAKRRNPPRLR